MFRRGGGTGGVKTMDGVMHGIETRSMNNLGGRIGYAFGTEQLVQGDTPQTLGPVTHGKGISNIDTGNFDLSNSAEYTQMYPSDGGIDIDLRQIAKVAQSVGISYKQLLAMTKQVSQQYGLGLKAALKVIMNQLAEGDVSLLDQLEGDQGANVEQFGSSDMVPMVPFEDQSGIATVRNGQEMMASGGRIGFSKRGTTSDIEDVKSQMTAVDALAGPAPDHLAQLLISGGLNLVSGVGAGTGSKLGDIAAAYKDPTAQAFKSMATDRSSNKVLAASLLKNLPKSIVDKLTRESFDIAEALGTPEKQPEIFKGLVDKHLHKDPKSKQERHLDHIDKMAKSYYDDLDVSDDRKIQYNSAQQVAKAVWELEQDDKNRDIAQKVLQNQPYIQEEFLFGATDGPNKGDIKIAEEHQDELSVGAVYYNYRNRTWYEVFEDGILKPVVFK